MEKFNMKQWLVENKSGMYSRINENGCYFIEDLHMVYSQGFGNRLTNPNSFINFSKSRL